MRAGKTGRRDAEKKSARKRDERSGLSSLELAAWCDDVRCDGMIPRRGRIREDVCGGRNATTETKRQVRKLFVRRFAPLAGCARVLSALGGLARSVAAGGAVDNCDLVVELWRRLRPERRGLVGPKTGFLVFGGRVVDQFPRAFRQLLLVVGVFGDGADDGDLERRQFRDWHGLGRPSDLER